MNDSTHSTESKKSSTSLNAKASTIESKNKDAK